MEPKYRFTLSEDALGVVVDLHGPGMPTPPYGVHTQQHLNSWAEEVIRTQPARASCEIEAERIVALLDAAYAAGKQARSEELRQLLGVKS